MSSLRKYQKDVYQCFRCGYCRDVVAPRTLGSIFSPLGINGICPVYDVKRFDHYSARGRLQIARGILEEHLEYTPSLTETIYTCLCCGACREICLADPNNPGRRGINTPAVLLAMREDIVKAGLAPRTIVESASNIKENLNPYGESKDDRIKWARELDIVKKADTAFFVGCASAYKRKEIGRSTAKILAKAGVKFSVLEEEWCCGLPLIDMGFRDLAQEFINHNIEALSRFNRVVFSCPECYRTFKNYYKQLPFQVAHITEFVSDLIEGGDIKLSKGVDKKVTYHDPCHLGRGMGIYDAPRKILAKIPELQLVEMLPTRQYAWCCGAGGGVKAMFPDLSINIASRKLRLAQETCATAVVSACPHCKTNLLDAVEETRIDFNIYDITELVAKSMGA